MTRDLTDEETSALTRLLTKTIDDDRYPLSRKMRRVGFVVEDRGLKRRLHLGEDARRDRGGEMAEKKRFHRGRFLATSSRLLRCRSCA